METLTAFPPAHGLAVYLSKIDYKKHLNKYMDIIEIIVLTIAAVAYVLGQKIAEWYKNGGKDLTIQTIKKVWNFLQVSYTWMRDNGIPTVKNTVDNVIETIQAFRSLLTVA